MKRLFLALFIIFLVVLPVYPDTPEFWLNQMNSIGIASLVVLGLVVLTGVGGMTSFGQAAFVGIGAYATAYLSTTAGYSPWVGLVVAIALTFIVSYVLGQITLGLSGHYLPLSTIAVCLVFYYLYGNLGFLGRHDGIPGIPPIEIFGFSLLKAKHIYYLIWACVLLAVWLSINLLDSRPGRAIRSLKSGAGMAESFGVHTKYYKVVAFVYAGVLAGLAGWLYAHEQRAVSPSTFGINYGIEYLFMAVIGGSASIWGAVFGSTLILTMKDHIQDIVPQLLNTSANFEMVVFGILMVLILHHAREGLWPILVNFMAKISGSKLVQPKPVPQAASVLPRRNRPQHGEVILEVDKIRKEFGGLVAVNDISFKIQAGQIMGLIGPNGAGKSTTFNLITGVHSLTSGSVQFMGQEIGSLSSRQIAALGVGRTFQHVQLLPTMSVLENVALGAHLRANTGIVKSMLHLERETEAQMLQEAKLQLERVGLADYLHEQAGNLSLGQQRIVEIARALALDPTLLLLDEPAAGLRYKEKQELASVLSGLRDEGMSILLVEHDMDFVMRLTNHLVVMDFGTRIAEGTPEQIQVDPVVLEAYLGGVDEDLGISIDAKGANA